MTRTLHEKAAGELGRALAVIIESDFESIHAFAKRLGFGTWSISRWISGEITPSRAAALALCALYPDLRPLLEAKGSFRERERKQPRLARGAMTRAQTAAQHEAAMQGVERHRMRMARRDLIAVLAPAHTRRARLRRSLAQKRAAKAAADVRYQEATGERLQRKAIDDALDFLSGDFVPSYAMEGM